MLDMAKKKTDAHKGAQVPFRVDDPRLIEALDAFASKTRRSRNMGIVILLEEALTAQGLWPPPAVEVPAPVEAPSVEAPAPKKGKAKKGKGVS